MPPKRILLQFAELAEAISKSNEERLQSALDSGIDVNGTDIHGRTLLMFAAELGKLDVVKRLVARGAKLNTRDRLNFHDGGGKTALHYAVQSRRPEVAEFLLSKGADTEVQDKSNQTSLYLAVANGDLAMTKLLLDAGADPNGSGRVGTPLSTASVMGYTEVARLLLEHEADPNHPADARRPVLASAVYAKKPELCTLLIEAGAEVNATDEDGKTAADLVGLTKMPDRLPGISLSEKQIIKLRERIAAAAEIRSILLRAGADESRSNRSSPTK